MLLKKIYRALKPGGYFVFDVIKYNHFQKILDSSNWFVSSGDDFWSKDPHLVLEQNRDYPEGKAHLTKFIVITQTGEIKIYNIWHHYYSKEEIVEELNKNKFEVVSVFSDLTGSPYSNDEEWIGIFSQKKL